MNKFLLYYNFIVVAFIVVAGFLTATNYTQLLVAIAFFPLMAYFMAKIYPRRNRAIRPLEESKVVILEKDLSPENEKLKKAGVDVDRRAFLKLIGTAGLSLFIFSLFTKRAEAAFFGSVPGPGTVSLKDSSGNKIDPAEKHPTDGYKIAELDDGLTYTYAGYINKSGNWFILRDDGSSYRYVKGTSSFTTNWTNRASLTYDYYDNVF